MTSIFVGSSSEALQSGALENVIVALRTAFPSMTIRPWTEVFEQGKFTLDQLVRETKSTDFAVLLFPKDDIIRSRNKEHPITRANVHIEYGMFVSKLGSRRVVPLVEQGVIIPSDLDGLVRIVFPSLANMGALEKKRLVSELRKAWGNPRDLGKIGLDRTLRAVQERAVNTMDRLIFGPGDFLGVNDPVVLDNDHIDTAYKDALSQISERFWTTTHLHSGFWTTNAAEAVQTNSKMLSRISSNPNHNVKRIFLLDYPASEFIRRSYTEVTSMRSWAGEDAIQAYIGRVENHFRNMQSLERDGCQTRVACDIRQEKWGRLNNVAQQPHREADTEIAIYDDFRIDFFSGGSRGAIDRVQCFISDTKKFDDIKFATEEYFCELWDAGTSASEFLLKWRDSVHLAATAIDYDPQWIWKYDEDFSARDKRLKDSEMRQTINYINSHKPDRIKKYLDIGTCTGRYPLEFYRASIFKNMEYTIAIDSDAECIQRTNSKIINNNIKNIFTENDDFLIWGDDQCQRGKKFDLITCMLGTVSHFGAPVPSHKGGRVELAIDYMLKLLDDEGILIIGAWNKSAIRQRWFLSMYTDTSEALLANWSPDPAHIQKIVERAGFKAEAAEVDGRLRVFSITR